MNNTLFPDDFCFQFMLLVYLGQSPHSPHEHCVIHLHSNERTSFGLIPCPLWLTLSIPFFPFLLNCSLIFSSASCQQDLKTIPSFVCCTAAPICLTAPTCGEYVSFSPDASDDAVYFLHIFNRNAAVRTAAAN